MKTHQCALDNAAKNSALPIFCYKWVNLFFYSRHQISTAYLWLAKGVSHFNKWWPTSTLTFENKQMSLSTNEDTCIFLKVKLVRDSGPRLCYNIMDPNDCGHQCTSLKTSKCHCQLMRIPAFFWYGPIAEQLFWIQKAWLVPQASVLVTFIWSIILE